MVSTSSASTIAQLALQNISFDTNTTFLKLQAGGRLGFVYQSPNL
jgi:hypothetical protein